MGAAVSEPMPEGASDLLAWLDRWAPADRTKPFTSEACLYELLGKEAARTFLAWLDRLRVAVGEAPCSSSSPSSRVVATLQPPAERRLTDSGGPIRDAASSTGKDQRQVRHVVAFTLTGRLEVSSDDPQDVADALAMLKRAKDEFKCDLRWRVFSPRGPDATNEPEQHGLPEE